MVFQDYLTKWPLVFPVPDQKAIALVRRLIEEVVPFFGVPEALLSDRGANLLSLLMQDVCQLLRVKKLNTTAYHPQCDGMVERFNRTLKAMLRKHASTEGGTATYPQFYGHTGTRHISPPVRSLLSSSLVTTVELPRKLPCCRPPH